MSVIPLQHDRLVLDTSVIVKWFRQGEILAKPALVLRDAYLNGQAAIAAPSLLIYELTDVLRYKSDLSVYQVQQAAESLFEMDLLIVPPTASVMQLAVDIARTYDITIYDAAFVALAQTLPAAFVTADERLSKRLVAFSFVYFLGEVPV